jgi:DNA-directed RNA polymerase specialized sigma subunit
MEDRLLEVKKELRSYIRYKDEITWKQSRINELKEILYSLPIYSNGERVNCTPKANDRIEYLIDRIDEMKQELLDYATAMEKIEQKLDKLDYESKKVLRLHYINRKFLKDIAVEVKYSYAGIKDLHRRGLEKYANL